MNFALSSRDSYEKAIAFLRTLVQDEKDPYDRDVLLRNIKELEHEFLLYELSKNQ